MKKLLAIPFALVMTAALSGCGADLGAPRRGQDDPAARSAVSDAGATVSDASGRFADEAAMLRWLREEEKLARDVYAALQGLAGPFAHIVGSEQTHTDAVRSLLDRYGVADPAAGRGEASFSEPALQSLHDALVAQGRASSVAALQVGAEVEELDIADLREMRAVATHDDVRATLDALERGSRNHLRAFWRQLQSAGASYTPRHLPPEEFFAIAGSPSESGP